MAPVVFLDNGSPQRTFLRGARPHVANLPLLHRGGSITFCDCRLPIAHTRTHVERLYRWTLLAEHRKRVLYPQRPPGTHMAVVTAVEIML